MKALFVNAPSPDRYIYIRDTNRSGRRSIERTIWPQTSLAMMAGVLNDCEVKIIDCMAEKMDYKTLFEQMKEFNPDWVITNPISSIFEHDMIVVHYAKSLGAKTVVISPHAKALKEKVYGQYPSIDHIINFERGGREIEYTLREVMGIGNGEGTSFADMPPARQDLLPTKHYNLPFIGKGFTFVVISRGCPYKCIFCRQGVSYEGEVRYREVDRVLEEIERYDIRNFAIHSDTATLNKEWLREFCRRIPRGRRWICNSRTDTVTLELLKEMKEAGCWMICFGIESGDDNVLELNKKGANCEQAKEAVKWAKEAGIKVWGYFMLGLYGDTYETMQRTIEFACRLPLDIANFAVSAPYPGTEWNSISTRNSWLPTGYANHMAFDQNFSAIVDQPDCPASLVKHMQKKAYMKWYLSWRGLKMFLTNPRFFWNALCDHIRSIY